MSVRFFIHDSWRERMLAAVMADGLDWRSLAEGQKGFGRLILKRYYKGIQALKKAIQRIRKPFFNLQKLFFGALPEIN